MNKKISMLLGVAAMLGINQQANAAGFALIEQSVSAMGTAYASGAAGIEDASIIFFNPAGITRLCGLQTVSGYHLVIPSVDYDDDDSILFPGVNAGPVAPSNSGGVGAIVPLTGNDGRNAGEAAVVSNFYVSKQFSNCLWGGLAVTAPFGLVTDYDNSWKGRYHALRSSLLTIDINPVFAWKINNCWSIGGGLRALYAHAKLSSNVDYGSIAWLATQDPTVIPPAAQAIAQTGLNLAGFLPQEEDGRVHLKGNAWGFGGNVGILYEPWCGTRFGFNWRSQIHLDIKGSERFSRLPSLIEDPGQLAGGPLAGLIPLFEGIQAAAATDSRAHAEVTLPDLFQFSAFHQINPCWAVMGDITWTRWELLERLRFRFNNDAQPDGITTLKWENTLRYALGVIYTPNCCWKLRSGVAWDETPVPNKELRTPRIPDGSRLWVTAGLGYRWSNCLRLDFGYAHLFVPTDPKIDKSGFEEEEDFVRGGLDGKYDAWTDIVSVQFVWDW
jgi:long-chain fatty acid transport protein